MVEMKYMGSKARHAKEILPIILKDRQPGQYYVEPFVGGFNTIDKVGGKRIAGDNNVYLIALFRAIQEDWKPPIEVSNEDYILAQRNKNNFEPHETGFIGFGCSYSGKWFGGYARGNSKNGNPRNYCLESRKNILAQYNGLQGIDINCCEYNNLIIPESSIIYCDPPYANTTKYHTHFDHDKFWKWCEFMATEGNKVFVSEYSAPVNWRCVWEKRVNNTLVKNTGSKQGVERLFTL